MLEKSSINVRFIPIICSVPLLYAHAAGLFEKHGLHVCLVPTPGWSGVKDLLVYDKIDAAHMLVPMPFACTAGIDGKPTELRLCMLQNQNGQALALAARHRGIGSPAELRGMVLAVPYQYSMQYYLLCHYLAEHGLDPLHDVRIEEVVPPQMPLYLKKGWIDGFLGPEPYPQIVVQQQTGFLFKLSKEIWDGHPCCCVAVHARFLSECPNTARAFLRGILAAQQALHAADAAQGEAIADLVSGPAYLNVSHRHFVAQALAGHLSDGTGRDLVVSKYVDFMPHLPLEHAEWTISQMQRWGQLPIDVDPTELAHRVCQCSLVEELTAGTEVAQDTGKKAIVPTPLQLEVTQQAFAVPRRTTSGHKSYEMSARLRMRFGEILQHLAEVAGGQMHESLEITSQDEVGWLEQVINEVVRSAKYVQQALSAEAEAVAEAESLRQRAIIEAQRDLVMQLSTPIIPLLPSTLLVPLIGTIDVERALRISESILAAVSVHRARTVLLDVTGLKTLDASIAGSLRQVATAIKLLGSQCVLVGISPQLASQLAALDSDLTDVSAFRNVASAVEYALERQRTLRHE